MGAKEKLAQLEKHFTERKIDKKISQNDDSFKMTVGEKEFIGNRLITHYFKEGKLIFACSHFTSDEYEYLQIDEPKENSEHPHGQMIYERLD